MWYSEIENIFKARKAFLIREFAVAACMTS